ncbi:hypothetical protein CSA56_11230 [candidate division KSB3 bacterium]|uniref:GerMN domain-containing protein n=1 Tax=candidate division KSB3 bacterium TaxID=2044937 RepID=A0A2G6KDA4_9BACT|nr:MAG: hypothetical protein CSA56_11230 [candidate division KSB3 bacterium]
MSKIWGVTIFLTIMFCIATWLLYANQSSEDTVGHVLSNPVLQPVSDSIESVEIPYRDVTLFVNDPMSGMLVRKTREIDKADDLLREIADAVELLIQPDEDSRNTAIPEGTELLSVFVSGTEIVYLNFSRHLQDRHIGGLSAELATVASVVNTLLSNFREVSHVQILVEGAEIETLAGHVDCRKPFSKLLLIDS